MIIIRFIVIMDKDIMSTKNFTVKEKVRSFPV